jgi:hypothetical protein
VAALALALLQQRECWAVYAALVPVMAGLVIAAGAEPSFHVIGFAATIGATVLRALKTVIQVTTGSDQLDSKSFHSIVSGSFKETLCRSDICSLRALSGECLSCTIQGMLLKDVEPVLILRHMAFFATLILLLATAALEGDVLQRLPPAASAQFYATMVLNCGLAMASNLLNMLVTRANGALSLQVQASPCTSL